MNISRILYALFFGLFLTVHAYGDGSVTIITPVQDQKFEVGETVPIEWTDQSSTPVPIIIYANHYHSSAQTTIEGLMSDAGSASIIGGLPSPGYWDIVIFFEIELASVRILVEDPPVELPDDNASIGYITSFDPYRRRGDENRLCCVVIQYSGQTHIRMHVQGFDSFGLLNEYQYSTGPASNELSSLIRNNVELVLDIYHTPPQGDTYLKATLFVPPHPPSVTFVSGNITCENGQYDAYLRVVSTNNSVTYHVTGTQNGVPIFITYRPAAVVGDTRYVLGFVISDCLDEGGPPGGGDPEGAWTREDIDQLLTISEDDPGADFEYQPNEPGEGDPSLEGSLTELSSIFPDASILDDPQFPTWTITFPAIPGQEPITLEFDFRPDLSTPTGQLIDDARLLVRTFFGLLLVAKFAWMVINVIRTF